MRRYQPAAPSHSIAQDEAFHVAQTQQYCAGIWGACRSAGGVLAGGPAARRITLSLHPTLAAGYDPKITTPPGLYWVGVAWAAGLRALGVGQPCGTASLRFLSAALGGVAAGAVYELAGDAQGRRDHWLTRLARTAAVVTLPFYAFFGSLYYTETASVAAVLVCLVAARRTAAPGFMSLPYTFAAATVRRRRVTTDG